MARLFNICYQDDCDVENYLKVIEDDRLSKEKIEDIEFEELEEHCSCLMSVSAIEITEINGYKIKLEKGSELKMTIAEIINNQYGEGSVDKVLQKCKDLHMTLDGIKETANMLSCMIEKPDEWFKNDFDKDLAQAIDNTCMLFNCHPDFKNKEMCVLNIIKKEVN